MLYNVFGMFLTESIGGAARVLLANARTLLVWLVSKMLVLKHGLVVQL